MVDRQPTNPGRVRLNPVSGQPNVFDMSMADGATEQGTPLNKATFLKDSTAALYGLTNAVPDDVFSWLGKYNEHCWKKTSITPIFGNLSSNVSIIRGTETRSILYSSNLTTDSNGNIVLENPSTYTTQGNVDAAIYIANLAPVYITNGYADNSAIYFVPEGSTGGTANEVTVAWNGSYVVLHGEAEWVTISAKKVVGMTKGDSTFVFSTNRNAYPDSGIVDGYEYQYIGVPFDNLTKDHVKIETGSYVGTGTYGASNPNSLTFSFSPSLVIMSGKPFSGSAEYPDIGFFVKNAPLGGMIRNGRSNATLKGATLYPTWGAKALSWYVADPETSSYPAAQQLNASGMTFAYVAIG